MSLPIQLIAAHVDQAYTRQCFRLRFAHPVLFVDEVVVDDCDYALLHQALLEPLDARASRQSARRTYIMWWLPGIHKHSAKHL